MRLKALLCLFILMTASALGIAQADDPTRKLGALLGKWQTEGALTGSDNKVTSALECRWSQQGNYLVCEQLVKMAGGDHRQLTIYSYNSKDGNYSYTTIADPGAKPTSGTLAIKGNVWTYSTSFENDGKTTQIRTTNEFKDPGTEVFKVESSRDGGVTWNVFLEGTAHKTAD
jgi:Protein of unknown function (DUF1579)